MENNKKMTKREMFSALLAKYDFNETEREFLEHELELIAKKNSADKKPTAQQIANDGIKNVILEVLADNKQMTVSEMQKANAELGELSNQRISALIRQMIADNVLERIEDKRKAYFRMV